MKKFNGELYFRDHILLFMIAVMTFLLPPLLFQPRKNLPLQKIPSKPPVVLAPGNSYQPDGFKELLYYHDPEVFLKGDDAHSFAAFRIREQKPEYLQQQIGGFPTLVDDMSGSTLSGKLPGDDRVTFTAPLFQPMTFEARTAKVQTVPAYPLLFNTDGNPLPDCRFKLNKNAAIPQKPTKLQICVPTLETIPGFIYAELHTSCGNRRLDLLAQRTVNQYLLANSKRNWQNGGVLTVYWHQNVKPAAIPEDTEKEDRS